MTIKAVIWDLGGVLVRTEDSAPRERLASSLGLTRSDVERLVFSDQDGMRAQRGEIDIEGHWENVRRRLNLSPGAMEAFQDGFWGGDRLDEELVAYIRTLRTRYKTCLLSNAFSNLRNMVIHRWKIADAFDVMVISSEVGLVKPDSRIYQIVLDRLGVAPKEAVFIDDFLHNVTSAQNIGLFAIHFQKPSQARAELEALLNHGEL